LNCLEGIKAQEPKGQKVDMMNLKKTKGCDFDLLRGLPPKRKMLPNIMTEWRWHKRIYPSVQADEFAGADQACGNAAVGLWLQQVSDRRSW
jgi:hypothetical protein